jgi:DNA-binding transcriptional regulator LsrR (DeoR family)
MRIDTLYGAMPRLNIYLPDDVYELATRWRDQSNLSGICASAIRDELGAAEGNRSYSKVLTKIRPPSELESSLLRKFELADVVVAENSVDDSNVRDNLGKVAARYVDQNVADGSLMAIAGGRQMWCMVQHLSPRRVRTIITALGLHQADPQLLHVHPNTIATLMWLLYSPRSQAHVVGSMHGVNPWAQELPVREHPSYFVLASCSPLERDSPFAQLLGGGITTSLTQQKVIGDYAYVFFNRSGEEIEVPQTIDQFRLPAARLRDLSKRDDARTILVAGGRSKLSVIGTALKSKLCNTLITDKETADNLLE